MYARSEFANAAGSQPVGLRAQSITVPVVAALSGGKDDHHIVHSD